METTALLPLAVMRPSIINFRPSIQYRIKEQSSLNGFLESLDLNCRDTSKLFYESLEFKIAQSLKFQLILDENLRRNPGQPLWKRDLKLENVPHKHKFTS
jgi:hypothetical protein